MLDLPDWCYLRDRHDAENYNFIVHKTCPKGLHIKVKGSVMSYYDEVCQQCHTRPPEELLGVYRLYRWGIGNEPSKQRKNKP